MPKPRFTGDRRLIDKARHKKVAKYKLYKGYKSALKSSEAGPSAAPSYSGGDDLLHSDLPPQRAEEKWEKNNKWESKKSSKLHAAAAARKKWEQKNAEQLRAKEEAAAAKERRHAEIEAAKKRRSEQSAKLSKRNKRGQPVLGNQVEVMLAKLQRRS